jgi:hypothetical protein
MKEPTWPKIEEQLHRSKVTSNSNLDKMIRDNQDFHILQPEESNDNIDLPLWLRVHWRKKHPETSYSTNDPTGGYPRVLKRIHTLMMQNQDSVNHISSNSTDTSNQH